MSSGDHFGLFSNEVGNFLTYCSPKTTPSGTGASPPKEIRGCLKKGQWMSNGYKTSAHGKQVEDY